MTDITAKPFDWNDNLSKEAIEDFKGIQKDLPYCTCQSIGMALAKLELLEKQGQKLKTGHWSHDGSHWKNRFICSECEYKLFDEPTNYCPNCGVKMAEIDKYKAERSEE